MKRYNVILENNIEPENKSDLWLKGRKLKIFLDGVWKNIIGEAEIEVNNEDLSVNEANSAIEFSDRAFSSNNNRGYKIIRKNIIEGKNIINQDMINLPNTIYEIRYKFDANNNNIILPENSVLYFKGGSICNFTNLIGNNTEIKGNALFLFDINEGSISGTWKIDKWEAEWFGAINDGVYPPQDEADEIYLFEGTDNYNSIQGMLNAAIRTNINICHIKAGFYRVTKPLNMGYCDKAYYTCRLEGDNSYNGINYGHRTGEFGTILLIDHDYYGISVNAGRGSSIEGITLLGKNYGHMLRKGNIVKSLDNNDINYLDVNSYIGEQMKLIKDNGLSRYAPYAGIITDGTNWTDSSEPPVTEDLYRYPVFPNAVWDGTRKSGASSRTVIKNCIVTGFGVGIGLGLNNWWGNNEFTVIENCQITENIYGLVQGNGDARHTAINNTLINVGFIGVDTATFGTQKGSLVGLFQNCNFDALANMFNVYRPQDIKMLNCYAESTIRFGKIHYTYNRQSNMVIRDSSFMLKPVINDATPIPDYYIDGDNILLDNVHITQFKNLFVIKGSGNNIQIRDSKIYATSINSNATPLVITGTRAYQYNSKLVDSSVLDMYVSGNNASSRNNYLHVTNNYIGNIKKQYTSTQGWEVTHSYDDTTGELSLQIPTALNSYNGKLYTGDTITNNKTGIVFIITSVENSAKCNIKAKILNGYKVIDGRYELTDLYYGDYFTIICTRQVPLKDTVYITNIEGTTLTVDKWDDLFVEGAIIDHSYNDTLRFQYPQNGIIKSVNKEQKTITINGSIMDNTPLNIKGVITVDDLFLQYLNL